MKNLNIARFAGKGILFLAVCLLAACSTDQKEKQLIQSFENPDQPDKVEVISVEELGTIKGADSLAVIESYFNTEKARKLEHLQKAIEAADRAIEEAEKGKAGGFRSLEALFNETIDKSKRTKEEAEKLIASLNSDCKATDLEETYNQIQYYSTKSNDVLGYTVHASFKTEGSEEVISGTYLLSPDKSRILSKTSQAKTEEN